MSEQDHFSKAPVLRQVKASAGSGKTFDLTRRFLQHLARAAQRPHSPGCGLSAAGTSGAGSGWGDILAVTFTNSAAAEMKERVVRRLKECALSIAQEQDISPEQAALWVDIILRQYGALNIRTIDSLLHMVVRTAALDLGLPPDFEPSFATEETLAPILDICLERAWQGDTRMQGLLRAACRSLLFHGEAKGFMAGDKLGRALLPLLDMVMLGQVPELSPPEALEACYADMVQQFVLSAAVMRKHVDDEGLKVKSGVRETLLRCADGDLKAAGSAWLDKEHLDGCLLKAGQGKASALAQRDYVRMTEAVARLNTLGHLVRKGLELAPFVTLAQELAKELSAFQQEEGKVPGVLMPVLAREVLELEHGVPAALCRLGSALHHILVDEFQDTSREQWEALRPLVEEALSRGGSLTWVGDIKQAIYGWRGGDASLFDGVLQDDGLRAIAPQPQQQWLDTNWRSLAEVVRCNNTLFACLGQKETARETLRAMLPKDMPETVLAKAATLLADTFTKAAQQVRPHDLGLLDGTNGGQVSITPVTAAGAEALDEAVRDALHQRLVEDLAQRRRWGDITILVRSNAKAALVAAWLMDWQIPVITENSLLLAEHPLVTQSVAFLSFMDSPQDDLAFWTVLTGSIMAPCLRTEAAPASQDDDTPTLDELRQWALQRRGGYMSMAFRDSYPQFWKRWFAPFHGKAGLMSPYDMMQEWHSLLRVPQRFPQALTFVRRFLEVLHTAGERGAATLNTFLEHWKQSGGDEKVPMPTGMDAVNIMTIHKSKGLQFPVVIIPWMSFTGKADKPPLALAVEGLRLMAPRCKEVGDEHYAAQAQTASEALNLLYVAWTRAEQELHVFHTTTPGLLRIRGLGNALETLFPAAGFELPCQWGGEDIVEKAETALEPETALTEMDISATAPSEALADIAPAQAPWLPPVDWRPMQWLPRLKVYRNPLQELRMTATRRGLLTHHCLEQFQNTGDAHEDARRAVDHGLRTFALPLEGARDTLRQELLHAVSWYASLPDTARWMRHGLPEQTLVDEGNELHRADLLVPPARPGEQGYAGWLAVDYKTGWQVEQEKEKHVKQIRRYLHLLSALPAATDTDDGPLARPACGVLVYLDRQYCLMVTPDRISSPLPAPCWTDDFPTDAADKKTLA